MDSSDSGDLGSLWNSSVLLPSCPVVFFLPTTRPLYSPEEVHRLLQTR
jgi:hypothetical protein